VLLVLLHRTKQAQQSLPAAAPRAVQAGSRQQLLLLLVLLPLSRAHRLGQQQLLLVQMAAQPLQASALSLHATST
jgi:hypothetical protein